MEIGNFTDADAKRTILRALRMLGIATAIACPLMWWKMGWQSALLLLIGAGISGSGLWEWMRLMSALMAKMDEKPDGEGSGGKARPMAGVMIGFFLRLGLTFGVLYGSLKFLNGSVYALVAGVGLGIFALTFEALRLVKAWTV